MSLRRWVRQLAIPNLTIYLVMGQGIFYILGRAQPDFLAKVIFIPRDSLICLALARHCNNGSMPRIKISIRVQNRAPNDIGRVLIAVAGKI